MTQGVAGPVPDQAGWTLIAKASQGSTPTGMWYRLATASEPASYTFTASASGRITVSLHRLTGIDLTDPLDVAAVTAATGSAASITTPSLTTVTAGALLLYDVSAQTTAGTITPAAGTSMVTDTGGVDGRRQLVAQESRPAAGATGTRLWSFSQSLPAAAVAVAFRPGASGTPAAVVGVTATGTAVAPAGILEAGVVVTGATAPVTVTSPAGSADGSSSATVAGVTAVVTVAASAGTAVGGGFPVPTVAGRWAAPGLAGNANVTVSGLANTTSVRLKVGTDSAVTAGVVFGASVTPSAQGDADLTVTGLPTSTSTIRYYYKIAMLDGGGAEVLDSLPVGSFVMAPTGRAPLAICLGSCIDGVDSAALGAAADRNDDLFVLLGDALHDPAASSYADGTSTAVSHFRELFDDRIQAPNSARVFANGALKLPSDHDGLTNNSTAGAAPTAWANYNQVHREKVATAVALPANGIYHSIPWGTAIRLVVLDTRSFAQIGTTKLGATQLAWVKNIIDTATEDVIVIAQDGVWVSAAESGSDDWAGTIAEHNDLNDHIAASGKNVVVLGGDMHALAADNGTSVNNRAGIPVYQAAPLNNSASIKGGPYSAGPYPASGTAVVQQYGRLVITPNGDGTLTSAFTGYSSDNTVRVSQTDILLATPVPATVTGVTATAIAASPAGLIALGDDGVVAGVTAAVTVTAPAGTAVGGQVATVVGVTAQVTVEALAGLATAGGPIPGVTATATARAPAGAVAATGGGRQLWDGTAWQALAAEPLVWDGTSWVAVPVTFT